MAATLRRLFHKGCTWGLMETMLATVLLTLTLLLPPSRAQNDLEAVRTVDQCYGQPIPVACDPGYMVQVNKAFYRQTEDCRGGFHSNYCSEEEPSNPACVGNQTCIFTTPWVYLSTECGYSNNFLINYQCIPSASQVDVCQESVVFSLRGYVTSPDYPSKYPASSHCSLQVVVSPGHRINVYLLDLYLAYYNYEKSRQCVDAVWVADGTERTEYLCSGRQRGKVFTSRANKVTVYFSSEAQQYLNAKGFWLYYEAYVGETEGAFDAPSSPQDNATAERISQKELLTRLPVQPGVNYQQKEIIDEDKTMEEVEEEAMAELDKLQRLKEKIDEEIEREKLDSEEYDEYDKEDEEDNEYENEMSKEGQGDQPDDSKPSDYPDQEYNYEYEFITESPPRTSPSTIAPTTIPSTQTSSTTTTIPASTVEVADVDPGPGYSLNNTVIDDTQGDAHIEKTHNMSGSHAWNSDTAQYEETGLGAEQSSSSGSLDKATTGGIIGGTLAFLAILVVLVVLSVLWRRQQTGHRIAGSDGACLDDSDSSGAYSDIILAYGSSSTGSAETLDCDSPPATGRPNSAYDVPNTRLSPFSHDSNFQYGNPPRVPAPNVGPGQQHAWGSLVPIDEREEIIYAENKTPLSSIYHSLRRPKDGFQWGTLPRTKKEDTKAIDDIYHKIHMKKARSKSMEDLYTNVNGKRSKKTIKRRNSFSAGLFPSQSTERLATVGLGRGDYDVLLPPHYATLTRRRMDELRQQYQARSNYSDHAPYYMTQFREEPRLRDKPPNYTPVEISQSRQYTPAEPTPSRYTPSEPTPARYTAGSPGAPLGLGGSGAPLGLGGGRPGSAMPSRYHMVSPTPLAYHNHLLAGQGYERHFLGPAGDGYGRSSPWQHDYSHHLEPPYETMKIHNHTEDEVAL